MIEWLWQQKIRFLQKERNCHIWLISMTIRQTPSSGEYNVIVWNYFQLLRRPWDVSEGQEWTFHLSIVDIHLTSTVSPGCFDHLMTWSVWHFYKHALNSYPHHNPSYILFDSRLSCKFAPLQNYWELSLSSQPADWLSSSVFLILILWQFGVLS